MVSTQHTRTRSFVVWPGPLFVVLSLAGIVALNVIGTTAYPLPTASAVATQQWFVNNSGVATLSGVLQIVAALALLWFGTALVGRVRSVGASDVPYGTMTFVGATLAALAGLVSGVSQTIAAVGPVSQDVGTVQTLREVSFFSGGTLHVAFLGVALGAASLGLAGTGALPRWLTTAGTVIAVIAVLSLLSLLVDPAQYLIPVGRFLGYAWIVVTTVVLVRGGVPTRTGRS